MTLAKSYQNWAQARQCYPREWTLLKETHCPSLLQGLPGSWWKMLNSRSGQNFWWPVLWWLSSNYDSGSVFLRTKFLSSIFNLKWHLPRYLMVRLSVTKLLVVSQRLDVLFSCPSWTHWPPRPCWPPWPSGCPLWYRSHKKLMPSSYSQYTLKNFLHHHIGQDSG